jgi:AraC-like DNA-binding protein
MKPSLQAVTIAPNRSFRAFAHGYPYCTVSWHHHPEYEIHLVTATTGHCFIGDFIGRFAPGQLVMLGPDLPHNWVSDVPDGQSVAERCMVVQFGRDFIERLLEHFPELREADALLKASRHGLNFSAATAARARPLMEALCGAEGGLRQARVFLELLEALMADAEAQRLSSTACDAAADGFDAAGSLKGVLDYLGQNYMHDVREADLARLYNKSPSAFSRAFQRAVGVPFVKYLNALRVNAACELLSAGDGSVTEICFRVGYNNVSNFNRRFAALKGMSPQAFRRSFKAGLHWRLLASGHAFYRQHPPPRGALAAAPP